MSGRTGVLRRSLYELQRWWDEERLARRIVLDRTPSFILGMQKSGTSAVAGLVALRTGVPVAIDLAREWRRSTIVRAAASDRAFDRFVRRNAADFARPIVKEPHLTFVHERLLNRWPDARVAIVVRDPVMTIRSILDRLELPGDVDELSADQLASVPQAWRCVLDNRWLGIEAPHFIDQLALRWRRAASLAISMGDRWPMIRYEAFEEDKIGVVDELATFLGHEPVASIGTFLDRPFQPRGARRPPSEVFGRNLQRILDSTGDLAERLGYR